MERRLAAILAADVAEPAEAQPELIETIDRKLASVLDLESHTVIMDAALARDAERAVELMAGHIRLASEVYNRFQELIVDSRAA